MAARLPHGASLGGGGGIYSIGADFALEDAVVTGNDATDDGALGGGPLDQGRDDPVLGVLLGVPEHAQGEAPII